MCVCVWCDFVVLTRTVMAVLPSKSSRLRSSGVIDQVAIRIFCWLDLSPFHDEMVRS